MANSFAQRIDFTCPTCRTTFEIVEWLIIDTQERPDLLEKAVNNTLHTASCPQCGAQFNINLPLLIYDLCPETRLLFLPSPSATEDKNQEHTKILADILRQSLGPMWKDEWLEKMEEIPREVLGLALARDAAQMFQEIDRLQKENPEVYSALEQEIAQKDPFAQALLNSGEVRRLFRENPQIWESNDPEAMLRATYEHVARLRQQDPNSYKNYMDQMRQAARDHPLGALFEFFKADTWDESQKIILEHPEVLSQEADIVLSQLMQLAHAQGDQKLSDILQEHKTLLDRYRRLGISQVKRDLEQAPYHFEPLLDLSRQFIKAGSLNEAKQVLLANPDLLRAETDYLFGTLIMYAYKLGQDQSVPIIKERRALLRRSQEVGLNRAFSETFTKDTEKIDTDYSCSSRTDVQCRNCPTTFSIDAWLIVDTRVRPDLLERALADTLHTWHCPQCGAEARFDGPLLLYRSGAHPIVYSPARNTPQEIDQINGSNLLSTLRQTMGNTWSDELTSSVSFVPRDALADILKFFSIIETQMAAEEEEAMLQAAAQVFVAALEKSQKSTKQLYVASGQPISDDVGQMLTALGSMPNEAMSLIYRVGKTAEAYRANGTADALNAWAIASDNLLAHPQFDLLPVALQVMALSEGGRAKTAQYHVYRDLSYLDQAIYLLKKLVNSYSKNNTTLNLGETFLGLGSLFLRRFNRTNLLSDLDTAISNYQLSIQIDSATDWTRARSLSLLGICLQERARLTTDWSNIEEAYKAFRKVCAIGLNSAPEAVLSSGARWGRMALTVSQWDEAVMAFSYATEASEQLFKTRFLRTSKSAWLESSQSLPGLAAYALARNGSSSAATAAIERGRTRFLADMLERYRVDLERLITIGRNDLYLRYQSVIKRLEQFDQQEIIRSSSYTPSEVLVDISTARTELDSLIEDIRRQTGFQDFFHTLDFHQIQRVLTNEGAVGVYLLVTLVGGLALVVHTGGVKEVWLDLKEDEVDAWLVKRESESSIGGYLSAQLNQTLFKSSLHSMLPLLGDKILQPISETLRSMGVSDVTLIPCGRLALLPLHAAEYQVDGQTRRFMDEFTVTYTPSARALGSCQDTLAAMAEQSPALVGVGNPLPLPEGANPLTYAQPEVEEIARLFGQATTPLYEQQATREALDAQLGKTTYLHLSCHGTFNAQDPLESGVVLANGEMLTVRDLIGGQRLRGTRLVVLSACQTAITDFNDLPEEAIGLPGGFVQAGVPGVVGTLWPVNDLSTMLLMVKFYEAHLKDGLAPAAALRKAQLWLRDVTNAELSELFAKYRLTATDRPVSTRMAYEMASEKFREHTLRDPDERPYAHPYYWAPFVFYGV